MKQFTSLAALAAVVSIFSTQNQAQAQYQVGRQIVDYLCQELNAGVQARRITISRSQGVPNSHKATFTEGRTKNFKLIEEFDVKSIKGNLSNRLMSQYLDRGNPMGAVFKMDLSTQESTQGSYFASVKINSKSGRVEATFGCAPMMSTQ